MVATTSLTGSTTAPVIDPSNAKKSSNHWRMTVEQVREAAATWGFFQVVNHDVPVSVLEDTIEATRSFSMRTTTTTATLDAATAAAKDDVLGPEEGDRVRRHAFYDVDVSAQNHRLNAWMSPPEAEEIPATYRRELVEWDQHARKVSEILMELLGQGLGLEAGKFKEMGCGDTRVVVGQCYPYCSKLDRLTIGPESHTDYGFLTILFQNQVPGLQIKHGDEWVDVKPIVPEALIVNVGDFLQIISNGEYHSVEHRVLASLGEEPRFSIAEFFNVNKQNASTFYGPLPELLSPGKPALYRNFTIQDFQSIRCTKGAKIKSLVEALKMGT